MATNIETPVSRTRDATRNFGIFTCFCLSSCRYGVEYFADDDSSASCWSDVELVSGADDDFTNLPAEDNVGYAVIAIANIALRNVLPANHVCGIKYLRKRNSSIKV